MSTASDTAAVPPRAPSVFISYASEDRPAARALRDALGVAGLDVWYDESELGGGDAWDQKIRRQIRDCDYFMPVISATTEARKEGYFRREWRLATERTLDMADDVLFLLPVAIDGTSEIGARVPDKFLTVQWLRLPGGQPTPALHHLVRRILSGDHHALTRPPMAYHRPPAMVPAVPAPGEPPLLTATQPGEDPHVGSPPAMPPMPQVPEKGGFLHGIKFIAEAAWWALTAAWLLFKRLPKWARVVVSIWLVLTLFSSRSCSTGSGNSNNIRDSDAKPPPARNVDAQKNIRAIADRIAQSAREGKLHGGPEELAQLGAEIARGFSEGINEGAANGKPLLIVPFAPPAAEEPAEKFASAVFISLYGRIALERRGEVAVTPLPRGDHSDESLLARGRRFSSIYIIAAKLTGKPARELAVRLLTVADGSVAWAESFPIEGADPTAVAEKIAARAFEALPKK